MSISYRAMLQRERETNTNRPRHLRIEATRQTTSGKRPPSSLRPHDHRVVFKATHDTTCVYPKGFDRPLVEQETFVFNGASKLRASTRHAIMARYGTVS